MATRDLDGLDQTQPLEKTLQADSGSHDFGDVFACKSVNVSNQMCWNGLEEGQADYLIFQNEVG